MGFTQDISLEVLVPAVGLLSALVLIGLLAGSEARRLSCSERSPQHYRPAMTHRAPQPTSMWSACMRMVRLAVNGNRDVTPSRQAGSRTRRKHSLLDKGHGELHDHARWATVKTRRNGNGVPKSLRG